MNLTLAITVYNRWEMLLQSFAGIIDDPRIDEILIMDDNSEDQYWSRIKDLGKYNPKIKVIRQLSNRGMSENKRDAIAHSKNNWVIIGDSDNIFSKSYVDALFNAPHETLGEHIIYCPSFAKPNFDYRKYQGNIYFKSSSFQLLLQEKEFSCLMNTCNYVVHRDSYISVWEENKNARCADTIWFNYLWLKAGNAFYVVPGMEYEHRVHAESGFLKDVDYNMKKAEEIKKLIIAL